MRFKDWSIRIKLTIIIVTVSTIVLVILGSIFIAYDNKEFKKEFVRNHNRFCIYLDSQLDAPILFLDKKLAQETISRLKGYESVTQVVVYKFNKEDNTYDNFANYERENKKVKKLSSDAFLRDTAIFEDNSLIISRTIFNEYNFNEENKIEKVGLLILEAGLDEYNERLERFITTMVIILLSTFLSAILLALQFQKFISRPIVKLTDFMRNVTLNSDFSIRSDAEGNDEVGELSKGLNKMLKQIEYQNKSIEQQNKDLLAAKEQAEYSLKVKEQFLANMSHEIRTPMNAISGMARLLLETHIDKNQQMYLESIRISVDNLLVVINDILDFSKIEAGKILLEKKEFSLFEMVFRLKNILQFEISKKNLYFDIVLDKNVIPEYVIGDQVRLNQIILNLAGNAVKFTQKGGIKLVIEKKQDTNETVTLSFSVIDTGIGIDQDKLVSIFQSFNQASSNTTRKYGGSGLGLTISKQLIEIQGGKITVNSELGKGSNFSFTIVLTKVKKIKLAPIPISNNSKISHDLKNLDNQDIKVLIAEDNKINQLFASTILRKKKFKVDIADNGKIVLEKLQAQKYDIILMDLHMPEMDGYESTLNIRKNTDDRIKNIPIIALTAAATKGEVEKCFAVGMTDFISKPYTPEDLVEKILTLIANKKEHEA